MPTYLSRDWGPGLGFAAAIPETIVDAPPADIRLGTATRSGRWSPGHMRASSRSALAGCQSYCNLCAADRDTEHVQGVGVRAQAGRRTLTLVRRPAGSR